jgi:hypothetical protein
MSAPVFVSVSGERFAGGFAICCAVAMFLILFVRFSAPLTSKT